MNLNFEHYLALLPGLFWICLFVPAALAVVGILLARKLIAPHKRNPHHDIAHALLGPTATVFGILGAFIVATTWHEYADTRASLTEESSSLRDIYFDAQAFAPEYCHKLQNLCELYRDAVLTNEWRIVRKGEDDLLGNEIIHKISNFYRTYPLTTDKEHIYFTMGIETLAKLRKHREQRLEDSYMGLLPLLWLLFLLGGTTLIFCQSLYDFFSGTNSCRNGGSACHDDWDYDLCYYQPRLSFCRTNKTEQATLSFNSNET